MVKRERTNYLIQSVSHGIDVLEALASDTGIGVTELSKRLRLHKNNVFRLLATLELRGYVEQNRDTENYHLGVNALHLGQAYIAQSSLLQKATTILNELAEETGETVNLAVLKNGYVYFPLSIASKRTVRVSSRGSTSFVAKQCSVGRLLTAHLSDDILDETLGSTAQDVAIRNILSEVRSSGRLIDKGALETEVISIAKVVRDHTNQVVAAVEVLIPQYRAKIDDCLPKLDAAADALTAALGASNAPRSTLRSAIEKDVKTPKATTTTTVRQTGRKGTGAELVD